MATRIHVWSLAAALGCVTAVGLPVQAADEQPQQLAAIAPNMDVAMEYTLTVDGKVVDSTDGQEPFHYVQGHGQILEALEQQLSGLHVGESKEVTLTSEQGYGPVDAEAFVEIPRDRLPTDVTPEPGMTLQGANPETGKSFRARVHEVKEKTVILDLNHPLAGKPLTFKVTIKDIAPAKPAAAPAQPAAPAEKQPS